MDLKKFSVEVLIVVLASIVLAISVAFDNLPLAKTLAIIFLIILGVNVLVKKIVGYFLEIDVRTKVWSWYQYGFRKDSHFKTPVPMIWLPLLFSLFTKGAFWWLAVLEFDVAAKTERVAKRHGLYRFTEVTEWHIGWIAAWGLIANFALGIVGYIAGFELFAKLSIFYAAWSIIPLSGLDGSKILFASKGLWITLFTITLIVLGWGLTVI